MIYFFKLYKRIFLYIYIKKKTKTKTKKQKQNYYEYISKIYSIIIYIKRFIFNINN